MKHHAFREHFPESRPDQTHAARCDHASQCHSHAIQETVTAYYAFHLLNHQLQRGVCQQWHTHPHLTAVPRWWQHRGGLCTPAAPSLVPNTVDTNWHPHQQLGMRGQGLRHTPCSPEQGWNRGAVPPALSAATTAITEQDNNSDRGAQRLSSTSQWHLKGKGTAAIERHRCRKIWGCTTAIQEPSKPMAPTGRTCPICASAGISQDTWVSQQVHAWPPQWCKEPVPKLMSVMGGAQGPWSVLVVGQHPAQSPAQELLSAGCWAPSHTFVPWCNSPFTGILSWVLTLLPKNIDALNILRWWDWSQGCAPHPFLLPESKQGTPCRARKQLHPITQLSPLSH